VAKNWILPSLAAVAVAVGIVACGGGEDGGGEAKKVAATTLGGLVAVGESLSYATVLLIDADGNTKQVTSDANGAYSIDVTGMRAPFVIKAAGSIGTQEYNLVSMLASSTSGQNNAVQVTPLTTGIAALVNATNSYSADGLLPATVTPTSLAAATALMTTALSGPIAAAGLSSSFNPVTDTFSANRTGADQVLDVVDVRIKPSGVVLANRMEVLTDNTDPRNRVVTASGSAGDWPPGADPAGLALLDLQNKIKACFALSNTQRAPNALPDSGGFVTADMSQMAADCKSYVVSGYMHNTYSYGERWGLALSSSEFLNADVKITLRYVVDRPSMADGKAYVVNVNFKDTSGNWYTRPEVLERTTTGASDSFKLYGNRRNVDFSVDANYSYIDDLSTPANSRVEGRLQMNTTPHRTKAAGASSFAFSYDATDSKLAQPKIICAWVTGPLLQTNVVHDVNAPKGGILLKVPHPDAVATRNYMPIHAKYSADFDPVNNTTHRGYLWSDCKGTSGTPARIGTANTNNQFTFTSAKANGDSTWTYPGLAQRNYVIDSANVGTCVSGNCPRQTYANTRSTEVSSQDKLDYFSTFGNTSMPRYTIYVFQDDAYTNSSTTAWGNTNNSTNFWNSKTVENSRMVGTMAFLDKDANGLYAGDIKFRKPDASTVASYLGTTLSTIAAGTNVNVGWTVPSGVQGIDRFGGKGQAYFSSAGSERLIVASIAQVSKGSPRSASGGVLTLNDEWLGNDAIGTTKTYAGVPFAVTSVFREIWARSYDLENRQIQYVYTRKN
jgi:hypothetical protein